MMPPSQRRQHRLRLLPGEHAGSDAFLRLTVRGLTRYTEKSVNPRVISVQRLRRRNGEVKMHALRKSVTLVLALATLGFLSSTASARTYTKVNGRALQMACLNVGGTLTATGCSQPGIREVSCGNITSPSTTCTCTGNCPGPQQHTGPAGKKGLLDVLKGGMALQPAQMPANTKGGIAPPGVRAPVESGGFQRSPPSFTPSAPVLKSPATFQTTPSVLNLKSQGGLK
jgi:hypothetical protein